MDKYKFGEFIYNQRKLIGMTQDELGRKLNVTNKAVSKWETGETLPDIQLLEKLASTLNVTIDELLTQKKVEKVEEEKIVNVKPKIYLHIIQGIISLILLIAVVVLTIKLNGGSNEQILTKDNANSYLNINVCEKSYVDGEKLTIYGSIKPIENISIENFEITLSLSIQYYYHNDNNELSEALYVKRIVTYDGEQDGFTISVEPKDPLKNFKSFYGFNIVYEVVEAKGRVESLL